MTQTPEILECADGTKIAYNKTQGGQPGVVFLHGLMSDRGGTKALALAAHCAERGQAVLSFEL
ncbi:MAG: alpha/beta hydrolase, partial [Rhodospirillaceae bacterium]